MPKYDRFARDHSSIWPTRLPAGSDVCPGLVTRKSTPTSDDTLEDSLQSLFSYGHRGCQEPFAGGVSLRDNGVTPARREMCAAPGNSNPTTGMEEIC